MSVCSLRWFAEDMLNVGKWLVRESRDEVHARFWKALERLDTHMQPSHVRRGWDGMLAEEAVGRVRAEAQGVTECVEAPDYRGDADRMRAAYVPGSVAASATDGPTGVEPSPQAPPVGPPPNESPKRLSCTGSSSCVCDLHMYMAESDAVVAQFNEAEDRRLRLAMDLQEAVTEHTEHIDGVTDWIDVAYELQSSYVITPRRKTS